MLLAVITWKSEEMEIFILHSHSDSGAYVYWTVELYASENTARSLDQDEVRLCERMNGASNLAIQVPSILAANKRWIDVQIYAL